MGPSNRSNPNLTPTAQPPTKKQALGVAPPRSLTAHPPGAESILKSPATLQLKDEAGGPHIQVLCAYVCIFDVCIHN